jgi:transcriptional regulator of met regulon
VAERDTNEEAVRQVEKITDSEPVKGEELVESEELKRQFREAKERLDSELR